MAPNSQKCWWGDSPQVVMPVELFPLMTEGLPAARAYAAMARRADNRTGLLDSTIDQIAADAGMSRRRAAEGVARLLKSGWVGQVRQGNSRASSEYLMRATQATADHVDFDTVNHVEISMVKGAEIDTVKSVETSMVNHVETDTVGPAKTDISVKSGENPDKTPPTMSISTRLTMSKSTPPLLKDKNKKQNLFAPSALVETTDHAAATPEPEQLTSPAGLPRLPGNVAEAPDHPVETATQPQGADGNGGDALFGVGSPPANQAAKTKTTRHAYTPEFQAFWRAYPERNGSKRGKFAASQHWTKALKLVSAETLMAALRAYAATVGDYPVDAERWLKKRMWEDHQPAINGHALTFDALLAAADAKTAAALIRVPYADPSQHPSDPTPRNEWLCARRREWLNGHAAAIGAALAKAS